jgi:hypothetical protein
VNHAFMPICVEIVKSSYFIDWLFLSLDCDLVQNFFDHEQHKENSIYYYIRISTDPSSRWYPYANRWEYYRSFFLNSEYRNFVENYRFNPSSDPNQWTRPYLLVDKEKRAEIEKRRFWEDLKWIIKMHIIVIIVMMCRPRHKRWTEIWNIIFGDDYNEELEWVIEDTERYGRGVTPPVSPRRVRN